MKMEVNNIAALITGSGMIAEQAREGLSGFTASSIPSIEPAAIVSGSKIL